MSTISIENVSKGWNNVFAIKDLSIEIHDREFLVLLGPSGCGKTTTMRMIAGLEEPTSGRILFGGEDVTDLAPRDRDISMVFQNYGLYPHMTVRENIAYPLRIRKVPREQHEGLIAEAARRVELESLLDRKPKALSGGQRQRVALARAIVRQPKVFLFDEPLSNLDAQLRTEMRTEIKRLHQRLGATIIYVTHDQVEAMTLADRIVVLSAGHKMQYDTPKNVYNTPAALFVAGFTGSPAMNLVPCTLADGEVVLGHCRFALPPALARAGAAAKNLQFGIRPENIALDAGEGRVPVPAQVALTEPLGAETLVTLTVGNCELVARCPASFELHPGAPLTVYLSLSHMHLFDAGSGLALAA